MRSSPGRGSWGPVEPLVAANPGLATRFPWARTGPCGPNCTGMGRSALGARRSVVEVCDMAPHDSTVLDLTDEQGLLAADYVEYHPDGVRALLAALNLKPSGAAEVEEVQIFDLAVYRATGDRRLATLFGSAR